MDLSLFISLIAIIPILFSIRSIRKYQLFNKEFNREHRERDERYKLMVHLIDNRIAKKECYCTPECLKQIKDERLRVLLPPPPMRMMTRERIGSVIPPPNLRPFQFMSESSFGAP